MALAIFQQMDGPQKVMLHQLTTTGLRSDPGKNTWICGGVNNPIDFRQGLDVARITDVSVDHRNMVFDQQMPVSFASAPAEIINAKKSQLPNMSWQFHGHRGADETADAGDKDLHIGSASGFGS